MPIPAVHTFDWSTRRYAPIIKARARLLNQLRDPTPVRLTRDDNGSLVPTPVEPHEAETTLGALRLHALKTHYATNPGGPVDFIQDWLVTYDPRNTATPLIPFVLFDRQREFIEWLDESVRLREGGVVEKSRDMGITWLCVAYAVYCWLFKPGSKISFGSRKEVLVDKIGDPDSIFEKARIVVNNLPKELRPGDFELGNLKLVNRDTGSVIAGEAGDEMGRGGRSSLYFVDEAAFIDRPERVEAAISNNTDVRIDVSTPNGMGNPFYRKAHSREYRRFRFHWKQDPRKGEAWYASMKKKLEPHVLAQEVDIDYTASVERLVIQRKWVEAAVAINALVDWPVYHAGVGGLDVGGGGKGKSVFIDRFGPLVDPPVVWSDGDTTRTAVRAMEIARQRSVATFQYDVLGVGEGVLSTLTRLTTWTEEENLLREHPIDADAIPRLIARGIQANPINTGMPATDTIWSDGKRSSEKCLNLRAEIWWIMRDRLRKTYEKVLFLRGQSGGFDHPLDELLALPDDPELASQLCILTWDSTTGGKIVIESKNSLKVRGIPSPDLADALALTFVPDVALGGFSQTDIAGL